MKPFLSFGFKSKVAYFHDSLYESVYNKYELRNHKMIILLFLFCMHSHMNHRVDYHPHDTPHKKLIIRIIM